MLNKIALIENSMKSICDEDVRSFLRPIGLEVGEWNQVKFIEFDSSAQNGDYVQYKAPANSSELYNFSQHIAGWFVGKEWVIFHIDNSNVTDFIQQELLGRIVGNFDQKFLFEPGNSIIFEPSEDEFSGQRTSLLISNLIYLFLLFEGHAQFISSQSGKDGFISVQDGFLYSQFGQNGGNFFPPIQDFEKNRLRAPSWVINLLDAKDTSE
jgi:hypothetical protein